MNKLKPVRITLMGLVLAVTSFIVSQTHNERLSGSVDYIGTLQYSSDLLYFQLTCVLTHVPNYACNVSATTDTTFGGWGAIGTSTDNVGLFDYPSTSYGVNTTL